MEKCSCVHSYTAGGSILCDPSKRKDHLWVVFSFAMMGFEPFRMQHAGGMLLPPVQKLVATIIFAKGKNANQIPPSPPNKNRHSDTTE